MTEANARATREKLAKWNELIKQEKRLLECKQKIQCMSLEKIDHATEATVIRIAWAGGDNGIKSTEFGYECGFSAHETQRFFITLVDLKLAEITKQKEAL